jgi:hypothetical protein
MVTLQTAGGADWAPAGYLVEALVGSGATGEVWRAREVATGELVALKRLASTGALDEHDRLRREAALLAGVRSAHLVRLRTVLATGDGLVLVLDFAGGGSLAGLLASRHALPPAELVFVAAGVAQALVDVHAAGLVHGDVTPANVLFALDGRPLLSDLGAARLRGERAPAMATVAYADPSVLAGGEPQPASDVYGLAAVCYEALTGAPPAPVTGVAGAPGVHHVRRPLAVTTPLVSPRLADVVESGLDLVAERRPDAASFAAALASSCAATPVRLAGASVPIASAPTDRIGPAAARAGPALPVAPVRSSTVGHRVRTAARRSGRRLEADRLPRTLAVAAAAVGLLAASVAAGIWLAGRSSRSHPVAMPRAVTPARASPTTPGHPTPRRDPPTSPARTRAPASAPNATSPRGVVFVAVLRRLDARRDAAFVSGDRTALDDAYVVGSPPYVADARTLDAMLAVGERAAGLALRVRGVEVVARTPSRAVLRVVDELSPYRVVDRSGRVVVRRPGRDRRWWRVTLRRTHLGWRIAAVRTSR